MATGAELFGSYNDYRDSQGLPPVTKRTQQDRLNGLGYRDKHTRIPGHDGKVKRRALRNPFARERLNQIEQRRTWPHSGGYEAI